MSRVPSVREAKIWNDKCGSSKIIIRICRPQNPLRICRPQNPLRQVTTRRYIPLVCYQDLSEPFSSTSPRPNINRKSLNSLFESSSPLRDLFRDHQSASE